VTSWGGVGKTSEVLHRQQSARAPQRGEMARWREFLKFLCLCCRCEHLIHFAEYPKDGLKIRCTKEILRLFQPRVIFCCQYLVVLLAIFGYNSSLITKTSSSCGFILYYHISKHIYNYWNIVFKWCRNSVFQLLET